MAFEDVPLGSGGAAVPLCRISSRQCIACAHKAKLIPEVPPPGPTPVAPTLVRTAPEPAQFRVREVRMSAKPEHMEALEERDPNHLNQHVQVKTIFYKIPKALFILIGFMYGLINIKVALDTPISK